MEFVGEGLTRIGSRPLAVLERAARRLPPSSRLDALLTEQADLTAVERFAQFHEAAVEPLQAAYYEALLPATPPGPGQQLAFEVDLASCSGCKSCVAACHSLNGLDESETWRDVGLLIGGSGPLPVLQHLTTACHHCVDPACLKACPVDAYEKDPITGIVRHLDDQCFGCQYCTLACPYDVPKYQPSRGIVRKCDLCSDRLQAGEAPACVQSCPHEAIKIRVVDVAEVDRRADQGAFVPGAFDPAATRPTTRFLGLDAGVFRAAEPFELTPEHGHPPLSVMLVLTQLSVGAFALELAFRLAGADGGVAGRWLPALGLALGLIGLGASLAHLGRPLFAFRAVLGLRHSWLSREVVTLGLFAKLAATYVALDLGIGPALDAAPGRRLGLLVATVVAGLSGVACSVMVYHVVRRPFWHAAISGTKFAGTALVLGLATALASLALSGRANGGPAIALALAIAMAAKLGFEGRDLRRHDEGCDLDRTARLLRGPLRGWLSLRYGLGIAGGLVLPAIVLNTASTQPAVAGGLAVLSLGLLITGEWVERTLFFTASPKPRMPGVLPS